MNTLVFKGSSFVVLDVQHDLPRHENFPHGSMWSRALQRFVRGRTPYTHDKNRDVRKVWLHHTAGSTKAKGFRGPLATASYVIGDPKIVNDAPDTSFGRGWPGMPYHAYIPFSPVKHPKEGLPVIYQCWPPGWHTWHTKGHNRFGFGVVCQGSFDREPGEPGTKGHPSNLQYELVVAAWDEWLKPMLGLEDGDLYGHADATKPNCPGGTLYDFVIGRREKRTIRKLEATE